MVIIMSKKSIGKTIANIGISIVSGALSLLSKSSNDHSSLESKARQAGRQDILDQIKEAKANEAQAKAQMKDLSEQIKSKKFED